MVGIIIKPSGTPNPGGRKLQETISRMVMSSGVAPDQVDACMEWAFGKDVWDVPIYPTWVDRWNKLHPKLFHAGRKDKFVEFMYVVGFSFCVAVQKGKIGKRG
jgi:hypothetical protein